MEGTQWPGAPAARSAEPAKPLRTLGRWLAALLVLSALADAAAVLADIDQVDVLGRLAEGADVTIAEADASDRGLMLTGLAQLLAYIATVIVWLIWFRRAYINIPRLSTGTHRWGRGWAIGAWFVPFLNLIRPKQMMNDVWRATEPAPNDPVPLGERRVAPLLHWWWAAWIIISWIANLAGRLFFRAETIDDQLSGARLVLWSDALSIGLDLIALAVVVQVTRRHDHRLRQVEESVPPDAPVPPAPANSFPPPGAPGAPSPGPAA